MKHLFSIIETVAGIRTYYSTKVCFDKIANKVFSFTTEFKT